MADGFFSKIKMAFNSGGTDVAEGSQPKASEYVAWLPRYMLITSQIELKIDSTRPLPGANESDPDRAAPCLPDAEAVVNRIKVLCGLNPFRFADPAEGCFEETLMDHRLKFSVHFEDTQDRSTCTLYLSVST